MFHRSLAGGKKFVVSSVGGCKRRRACVTIRAITALSIVMREHRDQSFVPAPGRLSIELTTMFHWRKSLHAAHRRGASQLRTIVRAAVFARARCTRKCHSLSPWGRERKKVTRNFAVTAPSPLCISSSATVVRAPLGLCHLIAAGNQNCAIRARIAASSVIYSR